jgi:hypothetical protein
MNIDPAYLRGKSKREILRWFIDHVSASEEEQEEKDHRSGSSTDLNLYLLDNKGYEFGSLDEHINHITRSEHIDGHAKNFVEDHTFNEEIIQDSTAIVSITTPEKSRTDDCIWLQQGDYIWVLTTERQDWRKKTIENLIKYLPQVERLYLAADYLEKLTGDIVDSYVSGFTAQYHAPYADRRATLMFHGGTEEDLSKAREHFDAKPTRIEFDQTNSPAAAIEGASSNHGRLSLQSVREGSEEKAVDTLLAVSDDYQRLDKQSFEIAYDAGLNKLENGFDIDGFTAIELTNPDRDSSEAGDELIDEIKQEVLNSNQYRYGDRSQGTIRVFDTTHEEMFDIALEPPNIVIYPRSSTTALSLRDIVQEIFEFDSTYDHENVANPVSIV